MRIFNVDLSEFALPSGSPPSGGANDTLARRIIDFAERSACTDDAVREYFIARLAGDENVLAYICETAGGAGRDLRAAALSDIETLWAAIAAPPLPPYSPTVKREPSFPEYRRSLRALTAARSPAELTDLLIAHYSEFGGGRGARYAAFRWTAGAGAVGIDHPDVIRL
jgi:hypothetical protein